MKVMVWCAARGGMRSVVEAYQRDGFLERENVRLIASYCDGSFLKRQTVLLRALVAFVACLLRHRVELVHCHAAMRGSFWRKGLFASIARLFGIPVILHLHGSEMKPFYVSQRPFVQRLIRSRLEQASLVVVLSQSWKDFVQSIAPGARVTIVPNYVTVPEPIERSSRVGREILFLGLVGQRKGVYDLIESFLPLRDAHPEARLVIGGNGETEKAAALIRDRGLDAEVVLAGWIDGPAKTELLHRCGIYVLPSHNEGLPMSVLEAMAVGLPVVTTRAGGIPELVTDGVDGILIDAGDRTALTRALTRLVEDESLRERLGEAGRRRVEQTYSDRVVLPLLHQIYAEIGRSDLGTTVRVRT